MEEGEKRWKPRQQYKYYIYMGGHFMAHIIIINVCWNSETIFEVFCWLKAFKSLE